MDVIIIEILREEDQSVEDRILFRITRASSNPVNKIKNRLLGT